MRKRETCLCVHTPHTGNNIHRQDNGTKDGEFSQDVSVRFGALVHSNVDLGDVVAVRPAQKTVIRISQVQSDASKCPHLSKWERLPVIVTI